MDEVPGVEFIDPVDESQSINERCGSGATSPSLSARCSSCVWARRRAVCSAMTRCRSAVRQHFSQLQPRYLQYRLCPFRPILSPWFRQRAQFGGVRGFSELLLDAPFASVRLSYPDSDIVSIQVSCETMNSLKLRMPRALG